MLRNTRGYIIRPGCDDIHDVSISMRFGLCALGLIAADAV